MTFQAAHPSTDPINAIQEAGGQPPTKLKAELPTYVDSTMITCWRGCQQKFFKEFCLGLRPPGLSIDLHAGGCMATGLEVARQQIWAHNKSLDEALIRAEAAFQVAWGEFEIPDFKRTPKTRDRMWEAVVDYFRVYPPLTDPCPPYFDATGKPTFEYSFSVPLERSADGREFPLHPTTGDPFLYSGRFDLLGEYNGRPTPLDDKTAGSIGQYWSELWKLRNQFMGYVWACRQCGMDTEGVLVRGIGILTQEFKHVEHYQVYSNELLDRWLNQLCTDMWRIHDAWRDQAFEFDFADNCITFFKPCIFMDSCLSSNPAAWLSQMEVRRWDPLKKNPVGSDDPSKESAL